MTRDIQIELYLFETSWKLHGLFEESKTGKLIRDYFYNGNSKSKDSIELLWENKDGSIIGYEDYMKLGEENKKLFCEFYEWIGVVREGKLQGYIQQWYRNGRKRFAGNYMDGKRHGDFIIYKENGEEDFYGSYENDELLENNYGF
jgi:antitoxin component YwqK of YwqJK toxin-antitoxin module